VEFLANSLLDVFGMDLAFFESAIPVTHDIFNIVIASGWAILLGNLVFQAAKSMMSGLGFEADDPRETFTRTFVFAFFLLASRQICEIGLGLSASLIALLQVPDAVNITIIDENAFGIGASWLLVIIFSFVIMWQLVKLFLEVGERYFLVGLLTILAPWAFAMGGSKSTADIFKGWVRMFASMCLMMVLNVVILKIMLSVISSLPSGIECVPWMLLIVGIARVGRKIDSVVVKIGLNPAVTGDGMGKGLPGMLSYMVVRSAASKVLNTAGGASSTTKNGDSSSTSNARTAASATNTARTSSSSTPRGNASSQGKTSVSSRNTQGGTSVHSPSTSASGYDTSVNTSASGQSSVSSRNSAANNGVHSSAPSSATHQTSVTSRSAQASSATHNNAQSSTNSGSAGTPTTGGISSRGGTPNPVSASAGTSPKSASNAPAPARFSSAPPSAKPSRTRQNNAPTSGNAGTPTAGGNAGTSTASVTSRVQQGGASVRSSAQNANTSVTRNSVRSEANSTSERAPTANANPTQPDAPHGIAGTQPANPARPTSAAVPRSGIAGTPPTGGANVGNIPHANTNQPVGNAGNAAHNASRTSTSAPSSDIRHRGNTTSPPPPSQNPSAQTAPRSASRESTPPTRESSRQTQKPTPGIAGTPPNVTSNAAKSANPYTVRQPNLSKSASPNQTAKDVTGKRKKPKFKRGNEE